MTYTIDKNVPRPERSKYPWDDMESGDSFFVPCPEDRRIDTLQKNLTTLAKRALARMKRKKWKVITSRREEEGKFGVRIWIEAP